MGYSFDNATLDAYDADLLAAWKMDDASGGIVDLVGGNDGTEYGDPTYRESGIDAYCVAFDGSDYFSLGNPAALNISTDMTVSVWFKPTSTSGEQSLIAKVSNASEKQFSIIIDDGEIVVDYEYGGDNGQLSTSGASISTSSWNHVAVTITSGLVMTIYLNGSAIASDTMAHATTTGSDDWNIGRWGGTYAFRYYTGLIDEIVIWGASISADAVTALYNSGTGRFLVSQIRYAVSAASCASRATAVSATAAVLSVLRYTMYAVSPSTHDTRGPGQAVSAASQDVRAAAAAISSSAQDTRAAVAGRSLSALAARARRAAAAAAVSGSLQKSGYAVWAKNVDTGAWSELGFIAAGGTILSGVSLADGTYDLEARPWGWYWRECRDARRLRVTISGGAIAADLPPAVQNLRAGDLTALGRRLYWTWAAGYGVSTPTHFRLWFSASSPVDTSGDPDAAVAAQAAGYDCVYRYDQDAAGYVAVRAWDGTDHGPAAELALDYPSGSIAGPDRQWTTRGA